MRVGGPRARISPATLADRRPASAADPPTRAEEHLPWLPRARYYPGFFGAFFLVLLRIAIGWHFLTEGLERSNRPATGRKPFSAEIYLRNSTGPLAPYFRGMVPDVNGLALLDPARLKAGWEETSTGSPSTTGSTTTSRAKAAGAPGSSEAWADVLVQRPRERREAAEVLSRPRPRSQETERNPEALSFERERAWETRQDPGRGPQDADRRRSTAAGSELSRRGRCKLATPEQPGRPGLRRAVDLPRHGQPADDVRPDARWGSA